MYSIFIADLHLPISDSIESYNNFISFLDSIKESCSELYILGDLFTYWYEHSGVDFYSRNPALKAIKEFRNTGKSVYFIFGNRDFAAGEYFRKASNVDFIGPYLKIQSGNSTIFLTHGDLFAKKDIRYQLWRLFVRSPIAVLAFKSLPVGYAIYLADKIKEAAKGPVLNDIVGNMIVSGAKAWFRKGYDVIVSGHAHLKYYHKYNFEGRLGELYLIPEFKFPGEFLTLKDGEFKYIFFSNSR